MTYLTVGVKNMRGGYHFRVMGMDGQIDGIGLVSASRDGLVVVQTLPNGDLAVCPVENIEFSNIRGASQWGADFELKRFLDRLQVRASCSKGRGSQKLPICE